MRKNFGLLMTMYAMSAVGQENRHQEFLEALEEPLIRKKHKKIVFNEDIKKPIPKGCNEYNFTKSGKCNITAEMWSDYEYVFTCIARTEKKAQEKFQKFIDKAKT